MSGAVANAVSKSELRIIENRRRRMRIVRRQKMFLMLAVTVVLLVIAFFGWTLKLSAQNDNIVPKYKYYTVITVGWGESLEDIAGRYIDYEMYDSIDEYISEVCRINHIQDEDIVYAGDSMVVPYHSVVYK